jgi:hypothetical protein
MISTYRKDFPWEKKAQSRHILGKIKNKKIYNRQIFIISSKR